MLGYGFWFAAALIAAGFALWPRDDAFKDIDAKRKTLLANFAAGRCTIGDVFTGLRNLMAEFYESRLALK